MVFKPVFAAQQGVAALSDLGGIVQGLLEKILPFLGLAAGLMFLVAGFKLITSGGEKEAIQKAKATMTYAILGLVLVFVSWFILQFIEELTGVNVTEFKIGD